MLAPQRKQEQKKKNAGLSSVSQFFFCIFHPNLLLSFAPFFISVIIIVVIIIIITSVPLFREKEGVFLGGGAFLVFLCAFFFLSVSQFLRLRIAKVLRKKIVCCAKCSGEGLGGQGKKGLENFFVVVELKLKDKLLLGVLCLWGLEDL